MSGDTLIKGTKTGKNVAYPEEGPTQEVPVEKIEKEGEKKEEKKKRA